LGRRCRLSTCEFEEHAGQIKAPRGAKSALVVDVIQRQTSDFSVRELQQECPGVSLDMIRHLLDRLQKEGKIKSLGTGRSARWKKLNSAITHKLGNKLGNKNAK